jgi:hypothetical protein
VLSIEYSSQVLAISDRAAGQKDPFATGEGVTDVQEQEPPVNSPATHQVSVASTSINSVDSQNISFEDTSPIPLVKRPTARRSQETGGLNINSSVTTNGNAEDR